MVATLTFGERNGAPAGTPTNSLTNMNFGSDENANVDYAANPIDAGTFSYDKFFYIYVANMDTSNLVDNFRVAMSGTIDAQTSYFSNLSGSGDLPDDAYIQPINSGLSTLCNVDMPTTLTALAENLGTSGATSNGLATATTQTDYFTAQLEVSGSAAPGDLTQKTFHALYDES